MFPARAGGAEVVEGRMKAIFHVVWREGLYTAGFFLA